MLNNLYTIIFNNIRYAETFKTRSCICESINFKQTTLLARKIYIFQKNPMIYFKFIKGWRNKKIRLID